MKILKLITTPIFYIVMLLIAFIMFYPFIFSALAGFVERDLFSSLGSLLVIPKKFVFEAYQNIFSAGMLLALINTILRTLWMTFFYTINASLCGYVLARFKFPGKKLIIMYTLFLVMVPATLTLVPNYIMASKVPFFGGNNWLGQGGHGLINNPMALYLIVTGGQMGGSIVWTLFFQKSMSTIPTELDEAAFMDGAGFLRTLFQIILPVQKPIIAVIAINTAITAWTDFAGPFTFINDLKYNTLPGYLAALVAGLQQYGQPDYPQVFALAAFSTIPLLIIFFFLQKFIVQGIASTGIKG